MELVMLRDLGMLLQVWALACLLVIQGSTGNFFYFLLLFSVYDIYVHLMRNAVNSYFEINVLVALVM